jgi:hypothetical protein
MSEYRTIFNPDTNKFVDINRKIGKKILQKYINVLHDGGGKLDVDDTNKWVIETNSSDNNINEVNLFRGANNELDLLFIILAYIGAYDELLGLKGSRCLKKKIEDLYKENNLKNLLEKFELNTVGHGSFGRAITYKCTNNNKEFLVKIPFPNYTDNNLKTLPNNLDSINWEINCARKIGNSGSPFISQFIFGITLGGGDVKGKPEGKFINSSGNKKTIDELIKLIEAPYLEEIWRKIRKSSPTEDIESYSLIAIEKADDIIDTIFPGAGWTYQEFVEKAGGKDFYNFSFMGDDIFYPENKDKLLSIRTFLEKTRSDDEDDEEEFELTYNDDDEEILD